MVHQYGGRKTERKHMKLTSVRYLVDFLSDLNQQTLTRALFLIPLTPKIAIVYVCRQARSQLRVTHRHKSQCKQK